MKAESAANADWVIDADAYNVGYGTGVPTVGGSGTEANAQRIPTPAQSGITNSTTESYWSGGLSAWAVECVKSGKIVESLPIGGKITFGDATNPQDLSKYKMYVVCEPNILFSASEKTAILNYVQAGGNLFMIGNHTGSDRNFDGFDSPLIWNDLMSNNTVKTDPFGFTFNAEKLSQTSSNIANLPSNPILNGSFGKVAKIQTSGGNSLTINPLQNSSVTGLVFKTGATNNSNVLVASSTFGVGRVVVLCDSSLPDDGTGDQNDVLYDGWLADANGNHRTLILNATEWLTAVQAPLTATKGVVTPVTCKGAVNGAIALTTSGGTGTYTYLWSNGKTTNPATNLSGGTYSVTVASGTSSTIIKDIAVDEPTQLNVVVTIPNMLDCKNTSVQLAAAAQGGTAPYNYQWSVNQGLVKVSGIYNVTVTDKNGCTSVKANTITANTTPPDLSLNVESLSCNKSVAKLKAVSSVANASFLWAGPNNFSSTRKDTSASSIGNYSCTITNLSNGCSTSATATLSSTAATPDLMLSAEGITCAKAVAKLKASSTIPNATFAWSGLNFKSNKKDTSTYISGIYACTVTNPANGCTATKSVTITENGGNAPLQVTLKSKIDASDVLNGGKAEIEVKFGTMPYNYIWRDSQNKTIGSNSPIITELVKGIYTCEVSDANGCKSLFTVQIKQIIATKDIDNQLVVTIYPNPARDLIFIKSEENLPLTLYSLTGKSLFVAQTNQSLDIAFLPQGVYFVQVKGQRLLKFVKF
jgi:SprB repeat/Secretion system C-terminal sorting domain